MTLGKEGDIWTIEFEMYDDARPRQDFGLLEWTHADIQRMVGITAAIGRRRNRKSKRTND